MQALQKANGLPQTGTVDKATEAALRAELEAAGGAAAQEEMASTAALQQTLTLAGYWDGPVDGQWTDELTDALKEFQTDLGVKPTGEVDAATIAAFEEALAKAQATPSPSPTLASPRAPATVARRVAHRRTVTLDVISRRNGTRPSPAHPPRREHQPPDPTTAGSEP